MNTSFRSTLIAATSAALLALAPSAFAAGVTAPAANSTAIHHETVTGEHQAKGTQTAENNTNKPEEMNATTKIKTSPEATTKTSAEHPSTMAENTDKTQAAPSTNSSSEMNKTTKTTEHSVAPNNSTAKHSAETGTSSTHKAKL